MPNSVHPYYPLLETCLSYGATLVVVSKTRTIPETEKLYQMGQRIFAENRVQSLLEKAPEMHTDIEWHMIGHLQTNKVRSALPWVACIQSLDRLSLWQKLQTEAEERGIPVNCLLQIKIAKEETKYGWDVTELCHLLDSGICTSNPYVKINGVMGMASLTQDTAQVRKEMSQLKSNFDMLKSNYFAEDNAFMTISMGMSGDYRIALEEGSTMIRIGSLLFEDL